MKIPRTLVEEIFRQAEAEAPLEACGYLAGAGAEVRSRFPLANADRSPEHFSFEPAEQLRAVKEARRAGLSMLAVYHSHPASPARPSAEDIRLAFAPDILYVIASLLDGKRTIRAYRIVTGEVSEEPLEMVE